MSLDSTSGALIIINGLIRDGEFGPAPLSYGLDKGKCRY